MTDCPCWPVAPKTARMWDMLWAGSFWWGSSADDVQEWGYGRLEWEALRFDDYAD